LRTDGQGRYSFKSVLPGSYATGNAVYGTRTPHIHFDVSGKTERKVTQMFFPDQPLNEKDHVYGEAFTAKDTVLAKRVPLGAEMDAGALAFAWDLVIRG